MEEKKDANSKTKGITLIALVITIIVLLILVAISISTLTGENGILTKANLAKRKTIEETIREEIILAMQEIFAERLDKETLTNEKIAGYLSEKLDGIVIKEISDEKIIVDYKNYEFEIDSNYNIKIIGKSLINITYDLEPQGYTKDSITITFHIELVEGSYVKKIEPIGGEIEIIEELSKYKITENGLYKFKIIDDSDYEREITIPIEKLDKDAPNANVEFINQTNFQNGQIKAKVKLEDEKSGINIKNCKWVINQSNTEIGTNPSLYNGIFTSETQEITSGALSIPGNYYFHILTSDNAGNVKEIISSVATITPDKQAPNVSIEFITQTSAINGTIKAKVEIKDAESGVNLQKCRWIINQSSTLVGTNVDLYSGVFSSTTQDITSAKLTVPGSYFIHVLATDNAQNVKEYVSSTATIKNGYAISTPTDLQNVKNNLTASYYVINDINMSGFNFTTIPGVFNGQIDGQGYTISNLKINGQGGIFEKLGNNVYICNLLIKNVNVTSQAHAAVFATAIYKVGNSNIIFEKVGITGSVSSTSGSVGGFVGQTGRAGEGHKITFRDCYARVNVNNTSGYNVAGFAMADVYNADGKNAMIIANRCYWAGTNNGRGRTGAIFSRSDIGNNENQATHGAISVVNSYYNKELFTLTVPAATGGIGLTTAQMKVQSNYSGWDFSNTWYMGNDGYPELKFR